MERRTFLTSTLAASAAASVGSSAMGGLSQDSSAKGAVVTKGRLKQSVCRWCYSGIPLEQLCAAVAEIGMHSVELLGENEWHIPAEHGLTCAVANGPSGIPNGWNRIENHASFIKESERLLPLIAKAGIPQMIVFSGNRNGMPDDEGLRNCAAGIRQITPLAEELGVTIIMELLNSKRDHKDYMCDHTPWGVRLVEEVASDRFRLLYDIYHMQIMEGDVIQTIRDHGKWIGHYHTGGVPGRREVDDTQELYYPAICEAIVASGFEGFLGQEFVPSGDPLTSLRAAAGICDV